MLLIRERRGQRGGRGSSPGSRLARAITSRVRPTSRMAAGAVCVVVAIAVSVVLFIRANSADAIADAGRRAIEARDAEWLASLASPEESRRLGLSPAVVRGILEHTVWRGGPPGRLTIEARREPLVDEQSYTVQPVGGLRNGWQQPLELRLVHDRSGVRWRLLVSLLLGHSYGARPDGNGWWEAMGTIARTGRPLGLTGIRFAADCSPIPGQEWVPFDSPEYRSTVAAMRPPP